MGCAFVKVRSSILHALRRSFHGKMEVDPILQINEIIEDIKERYSMLSTDDWDEFCKELHSICRDGRIMWRLIDSYNQEQEKQKVKEIEVKITEMLNKGFEFSQMRIDGIDFWIREGRISQCDPDDDIPF